MSGKEAKLYKVEPNREDRNSGDVVFVHGLGGDYRDTWRADNKSADNKNAYKKNAYSFPELLQGAMPGVAVWSLDYPAEKTKWTQKGSDMSLYDRAVNVLDVLLSEGIGAKPVIFICHSLGGLLVKKLVRAAYDYKGNRGYGNIKNQIRGICFIATPHSGSNLAGMAGFINQLTWGATRKTQVVEALKADAPELRELGVWYKENVRAAADGGDGPTVMTAAYMENKKTNGLWVVAKGSADPGVTGCTPVSIDANHSGICKPVEGKGSHIFKSVKAFVSDVLATVPPVLPVLNVHPVHSVHPVHGVHNNTGTGAEVQPPTVKLIGENIYTGKMPVTGSEFFGREAELALLDSAWAAAHTHVVTLIAWGGVGKSALVNRWLNLMEREDYRGARRVYAWSFYSQGASEGKQASADLFMQEALAWFAPVTPGGVDPVTPGRANPAPRQGTAVEKGRRLAALIKKEPTLLILDGLEPLQHPPGEAQGLEGKLKDPGMAALLKGLAASGPGLCVITSRHGVADLSHRAGFAVEVTELEHLPDSAGVALLECLGVRGLETDRLAAVADFGGHALALSLLGRFVATVYNGDIRQRDRIPRLAVPRIKGGGHARRVMAAYEAWLGESPEKELLYILGLFDRPVAAGALAALKKSPPIPGVTAFLAALSEEEMAFTLASLKDANLLSRGEENLAKMPPAALRGPRDGAPWNPDSPSDSTPETLSTPKTPLTHETHVTPETLLTPLTHVTHVTPETLDCHPLVREYFGERFEAVNPEGWSAAHKRLYEYYKALPVKDRPDTLAEMEPLFAAVAHGCRAGLHKDTLYDVFWERIRRGEEAYIIHKLGAFGAYLSVLSNFFDKPWSRPAAGLTEADKAVILSWSAFGLRAVGRLQEAIQPMKAGLELNIKQKNWKEAARSAGNLSELMLTLGEVPSAVDVARRSVSHADSSGDDFLIMGIRTTLADALHLSGAVEEAEKLFLEAEEKQKKRQPQFPYLYSVQGFRYCDLLLGKGAFAEAMERAEKTLEWTKKYLGLLDVALDHLTLGRAWLQQAQQKESAEREKVPEEPGGDFARAGVFLDRAVAGLREAGAQEFLAKGLLARAAYYRHIRRYEKARLDLNESLDIAQSGCMKLFIVDYHLEMGKVERDVGKVKEAEEHFRIAGIIMAETGYKKRVPKVTKVN